MGKGVGTRTLRHPKVSPMSGDICNLCRGTEHLTTHLSGRYKGLRFLKCYFVSRVNDHIISLIMRLNLGCGPGPVLTDTYVHVDASRKLLLAKIPILNSLICKIYGFEHSWDSRVKFRNVTKLNLQPNTVHAVYSSHLLEHLYYSQSEELLRTLHQYLTIGGKIRLALPDYDAFISRYIDSYKINPVLAIKEFEESLLSHPLKKPTLRDQIWNKLVGDLHVHRWHPTYAIVYQLLFELGYKDITRREFRESKLDGIQFLENREFMTFYIEATK